MGVLYIVSAEEAVGKTAICAGLALNFLNAGKKVGYQKPSAAEKGDNDGDTNFMQKIPGLSNNIKGQGIVLVEAMVGEKASDAVSKATYEAVKEKKAMAIAVEAYSEQPSKFTKVYRGFGESFLGVIINKVPQSRLKAVKEEVAKQYGEGGIKVLGVIPENRVLTAITIGELAESIQGKILNNAEKAGELVENYMLGAMVVDSGLDYFGRKSNKAAVIRQDRPDMQLAALETNTNCLVLSGSNQPPLYNVLYKAESKGIPIIATETAVSDIVNNIENTLVNTRLNQEKKLAKLSEIVKQNLDMKVFG